MSPRSMTHPALYGLSLIAILAAVDAQAAQRTAPTFSIDVAADCNRYIENAAQPAVGDSFIQEGVIYRPGTLAAHSRALGCDCRVVHLRRLAAVEQHDVLPEQRFPGWVRVVERLRMRRADKRQQQDISQVGLSAFRDSRSPAVSFAPRIHACSFSSRASSRWGACAFFHTPAAYLFASTSVG